MYQEAVLPGLSVEHVCPGCGGHLARRDAVLSVFRPLTEKSVMEALANGEIRALGPDEPLRGHTTAKCPFRRLPPSVLYICDDDWATACKWMQRFDLITTPAEVDQCCKREGPFNTSG
ncbi:MULTISPECIES: hypothetical protein [unclassified Streptomyces]|uniref:hypothetical protein n=1 Tax=unclassified Streptomyces TaxID=2593676 RepID=UPI0024735EE6|nr:MULTISPECIES: hypothetical protein [unclassified Streptomyces]MDH6452408.1 hypothetical protein [Streptomyces sp. SAI-119]MDH6497036.1 hypothetical protein [Streptomyces sp. SAI-149]